MDSGGKPSLALGLTDPGYEKPLGESVYLGFGLEHQPIESLTLRLDLHNVLGWIDKDLNKRNYVLRLSEFRSESAAVSLTLNSSFEP